MADLSSASKATGSQGFEGRNLIFLFLFGFRYLRIVVHLIAFWLYRPTPIPIQPTLKPDDCTVIIPTVEPDNPDFNECLESILMNAPRAILIVTVGEELRRRTLEIVAPYSRSHPRTAIQVAKIDVADKRRQICCVIPLVSTAITVLADDHVFWPTVNFLSTMLAPFEDPQIGVVGTSKRVRRLPTGFGFQSFWNVIGALYLERHNFEVRATNTIDGGAFVISGRTAAHRTEILQDPAFIQGFTNERFFFDKFGPLNADDDNFITRWEVRRGWKIKFQYSEDATIETTLGTYPKFLCQCRRWARTTWRSNFASLFTDRTVWKAQPWCVYAVYVTSFVNFALFYDSALLYTLSQSTFANTFTVGALVAWILFTKTVKCLPYFCRHPADLVYLPGCFLFAYFHSFIKLFAGLTFWDTTWGGRNLAAIDQQCGEHEVHSRADGDAVNNTFSGDDQFNRDEQNDFLHGEITDNESRSNGEYEPSSRFRAYRRRGPYESSSWNIARRGNKPANELQFSRVDSAPISTPWGYVRSKNIHGKSANVLESHMPSHLYRNLKENRAKVSMVSQPTTLETTPIGVNGSGFDVFDIDRSESSVHGRNWKRGDSCNRLHDEGVSITIRNCNVLSA